MNEDLWFPRQQYSLLRLANTNEGRDILCLDSWQKRPYPIVAMKKNYVRYYRGCWDGWEHWITDVRVGAKWGNVIRFRWQAFKEALDRNTLLDILSWPATYDPKTGRRLHPVGGGSTTTVYPDPNPESTSVDGRVRRQVGGGEAFGTIRAGDGTTAGSDATSPQEQARLLQHATGANTWTNMTRGITLFNDPEISAADVITSATMEVALNNINNTSADPGFCLVQSTPAANDRLAAADYAQVGTTQQAPDLAISSLTADDSTYNAFTLDSTGLASIDIDGVTKFGHRLSNDRANSAPTWNASAQDDARVSVVQADNSGTSADPKLVILHSLAFTPRAIMF
jgi:hypothetical protein